MLKMGEYAQNVKSINLLNILILMFLEDYNQFVKNVKVKDVVLKNLDY